MIPYQPTTRFLFVGDGPTDAGRAADPEEIGNGYVRMIRDYMRAIRPTTAPLVVNRGTAGLGIVEWFERFPREALAQYSDLISMHFDVPPGGTGLSEWLTLYRQMLAMTRTRLPDSHIVLCQPAAVWTTASYEADARLRPFVHGLFELAMDFKTDLIAPFHEALAHARRNRKDIGWVTEAGEFTSSAHMLVAHTWLESTGIAPRPVS